MGQKGWQGRVFSWNCGHGSRPCTTHTVRFGLFWSQFSELLCATKFSSRPDFPNNVEVFFLSQMPTIPEGQMIDNRWTRIL